MRTELRFALALAGSALLHAGWLALPLRPAPARPVPAAPLSVTLLHTQHAPQAGRMLALPAIASAPAKPAPAAELSTEPSSAHEAPTAREPLPPADMPRPSSLPDWLAGFGSQDDPVFYPANELDVRAMPLDWIEPVMPEGLPAEIQRGQVELEIRIDEFGVVDSVTVISADPPGWFDQAAISGFERARWQPAVRQGRFVKSLKRVEVCFGECVPAIDQPAPLPTRMEQVQ